LGLPSNILSARCFTMAFGSVFWAIKQRKQIGGLSRRLWNER
jgi:hypothetical protein